MIRITTLLLLTGSTLLYFGGQAQAQMQSLSYTAKPKIIQTPDNQDSKSRLYVTPKSQAVPEQSVADMPDDDPLDLATRDLDDNAKEEMDRVFEIYKALSEKQRKTAARQPIKTEPTSNKSGTNAMRTLEPSAKTQQSSPGSFAGILERYQQKKSKGTATNSLSITDPDDLEQAEASSEENGGYNK